MRSTKVCARCGRTLSVKKFYKQRSRLDGRSSWCKLCQNKYHREWLLWESYGMTLAEYDEMWEVQGGVCALCGGTNLDGRRLTVDHDHETGEIRGLLCRICNSNVGRFTETSKMREALAEYFDDLEYKGGPTDVD